MPWRARVVKSVDTADLKSAAYKTGMPVRFRPRAPSELLQSLSKVEARNLIPYSI